MKKVFILEMLVVSVIVAIVYMYNFYPYITADSGDTFDHLNNVRRLLDEGRLPAARRAYPLFFYTIAGLVTVFRDYTIATLIFTFVFSFGANVFQIYGLKKIFNTSDWYAVIAGSLLSFIWPISLTILHANDVVGTMLKVYLTSGATAPYHNLTFLSAKPFAILSLVLFILILKSDRKIDYKLVILLAVSMFLSVLAKPCFYQCFAPAGTVYTIGYFFSKKCKELPRCISIAMAFVPATLWVIHSMQYNVSPLAVSLFESVSLYNNDGTSLVIILFRAVVYVLVTLFAVAFFGGDERKNLVGYCVLGALTYFFGLVEWLLLIFPESIWTLDTLWGYNVSMYIVFFLFAGAAYSLAGKNKLVFWGDNLVLGMHALVGLLVYLHF